ncbi:histidinol-phosphate transaminase [Leucobacter sp. GX0328]
MSERPAPAVRIRPEVAATPAYRQGSAPVKPGFKLSSNENPFPPLPGVLDAVAERARSTNRYAAAAMPELRAAIADDFGVDPASVHLAAGSVAILYQLVHAVAGAGDEYVHAWPSFEAYPGLGLASGARAVAVPLAAGARHDLEAMADAVTERTRAILVCSPNNPTGPAVRRAEFDRFMERVPADVLVVFDEAYAEFVTDADAVRGADVLPRNPNLVVLRTFSKAYGLAQLRIGFGVGDPALLTAAASVSIPLSVTGVAEAAALASLRPEARAVLEGQIAELVVRRDRLVAALRESGLAIPDAEGNFLWVPEGPRDQGGVPSAQGLAEAFAEAGTLVRPFAGHGVRISVGEDESLAEVVRVVRMHLAG